MPREWWFAQVIEQEVGPLGIAFLEKEEVGGAVFPALDSAPVILPPAYFDDRLLLRGRSGILLVARLCLTPKPVRDGSEWKSGRGLGEDAGNLRG